MGAVCLESDHSKRASARMVLGPHERTEITVTYWRVFIVVVFGALLVWEVVRDHYRIELLVFAGIVAVLYGGYWLWRSRSER
jgi:hypothetical protein